MRDLKPGDTVWWWTDGDPGDPEVGPAPDIYPTCGTYVRSVGAGKIAMIVKLDDETEHKVHRCWLLTASELHEMEVADAAHEGP
jgi:hypothetical protein